MIENEERALCFIHEIISEEDNHLTMRYPLFIQPLNYFPITTRYDPFKSSTYLSQFLHMSLNQISMIFSLEYSLHNYLLEIVEEDIREVFPLN